MNSPPSTLLAEREKWDDASGITVTVRVPTQPNVSAERQTRTEEACIRDNLLVGY